VEVFDSGSDGSNGRAAIIGWSPASVFTVHRRWRAINQKISIEPSPSLSNRIIVASNRDLHHIHHSRLAAFGNRSLAPAFSTKFER
jgi:hypothetical protein